MNDFSNKNKDQSEEDEVNILAESSVEFDSETALQDIDQLLAEEDPEFIRQISEIKVDSATVNLSIMDEVISSIDEKPRSSIRSNINWKLHIQNLFNFNADPKKVILFWGLVAVAGAIVFYGFKVSDMFFSKGLFLRSYAEWGPEVHSYNPLSESEPFYDNPRFAKNLMTMTKMFANVKASENSGANPMLALEINVEGMSAEAIIEIKDREAEFKDILLRQAEEFSYDELTSVEGKKTLLLKFHTALNANLTQGQVRRAMLKSFILKP